MRPGRLGNRQDQLHYTGSLEEPSTSLPSTGQSEEPTALLFGVPPLGGQVWHRPVPRAGNSPNDPFTAGQSLANYYCYASQY